MIRQGKDEKRENRLVFMNYDLVVVGGGLSGVCCSISALKPQIALCDFPKSKCAILTDCSPKQNVTILDFSSDIQTVI